MSIARATNRYLDALAYARASLGGAGILAPFALFAVVQGVVLLTLAAFTTPALAPAMVPVMRVLGGEAALHYPAHLVGLPATYQRIYLPLVATLGFALWSLAIWRLADRHDIGRDRRRHDLRSALPHILLTGVLFVGASVATGEAATRLVSTRAPDALGRAVLFASVGMTAVMQTFLVYAPVVLRVRGGNAWSALRTSAAHARRHFLVTFMLIATVLMAHLPIDFLLSRADRIAARFQPETVLHLMFASIALEMFTAYLLFAGITELAFPREGGLR